MRVAVLGGANVDLIGRAENRAEAGDSNPGAVRVSCGGVARNICEDLARLGAQTELLTAVGDDWAGALLTRACEQAGIGLSCVLHTGGRTGAYLAAEDADGELLAAVNDMRILEAITPAALERFAPVLDRADALVLDANLPERTIAFVAERWRGKPIFADPVSLPKAEKLRASLPYLYGIKPNRAELRLLSGEEDVSRGMRALRERGVEAVCVSLGAEGSRLLTGAGESRVRAPRVAIHGVTGAGDALFAGLIWALLSGQPEPEALRFGTAAAALTLQCDGAVRPDLNISLVQWAMKEYLL